MSAEFWAPAICAMAPVLQTEVIFFY
jgi:hypothetical protein